MRFSTNLLIFQLFTIPIYTKVSLCFYKNMFLKVASSYVKNAIFYLVHILTLYKYSVLWKVYSFESTSIYICTVAVRFFGGNLMPIGARAGCRRLFQILINLVIVIRACGRKRKFIRAVLLSFRQYSVYTSLGQFCWSFFVLIPRVMTYRIYVVHCAF